MLLLLKKFTIGNIGKVPSNRTCEPSWLVMSVSDGFPAESVIEIEKSTQPSVSDAIKVCVAENFSPSWDGVFADPANSTLKSF